MAELENAEAVEFEVADDAVTEEVQNESAVETEAESKLEVVQDEGEHELEEYSDGVQKRIKKLTYKFREAERREKAALEYAKGVHKELKDVKGRLNQSDKTLMGEYEGRLDGQLEKARADYKTAFDTGNSDKAAEANERLAKLASERDTVERARRRKEVEWEKADIELSADDDFDTQVQQQFQQQAPTDDRAVERAKENPWFGQDEAMTASAFAFHNQLVTEEGVDPTTDEYYNAVNERMREAFPHKFKANNRTAQTVAGSSRKAVKKSGRKVRLSSSEVDIAKRLGVPLEEYAKYKGAM